MAPGQILIELVIPFASVAATILGAFVIKKRRDKKKAEACRTFDMAHDHLQRIESLENKINTLTHSVLVCVSDKKMKSEIQDAVTDLRVEIECVNGRNLDLPAKGEMERYVDEACKRMLEHIGKCTDLDTVQILIEQAKNDVQNRIEEAVKKIAADEESDSTLEVELDEARAAWRKDIDKKIEDAVAEISSRCAIEWRKDMNRKIQEYDLALTKWVKQQIENHQPMMKVPDTFSSDTIHIPQHGVVESSDATELADDDLDDELDT